jgi:hypothetical protein
VDFRSQGELARPANSGVVLCRKCMDPLGIRSFNQYCDDRLSPIRQVIIVSMASHSLDEIDRMLRQVEPVDESTPAATLRQWRTALMPIWILVSFAIEVLSTDIEVLSIHNSTVEDVMQSIVAALPDILARGGVRNGWPFSLDTSAFSFAAEAAAIETEGLLELHQETARSDLDNPDIVRALLVRLELQKERLIDRRNMVELRIQTIQAVLVRQYSEGTASVDDWLS